MARANTIWRRHLFSSKERIKWELPHGPRFVGINGWYSGVGGPEDRVSQPLTKRHLLLSHGKLLSQRKGRSQFPFCSFPTLHLFFPSRHFNNRSKFKGKFPKEKLKPHPIWISTQFTLFFFKKKKSILEKQGQLTKQDT